MNAIKEIDNYRNTIIELGFKPTLINLEDDGEFFGFTVDYPHRGLLEFTIDEIAKGVIYLNIGNEFVNAPIIRAKLKSPSKIDVMNGITKIAEAIKPITI